MAETIPFRADVGRSAASVRTITLDDIKQALRRGLDDLDARSTRMFVYLIYPVLGLLLIWAAKQRDVIPLIFPLVSGFELVGPFFAVGLYQISRCRERGEAISVRSAFNVFRCPDKGALLTLGLILAALFFAWLVVALLPDLGRRHREKPGADGGVGIDRRRVAIRGRLAGARRIGRGVSDLGSRDVASLSAGGGVAELPLKN